MATGERGGESRNVMLKIMSCRMIMAIGHIYRDIYTILWYNTVYNDTVVHNCIKMGGYVLERLGLGGKVQRAG